MPQDNTGDARRPSSSKLSVLRKHEIFSDLDNEALEQLGRYAKHTMLKRGATIFSKGDPGNSLYAVVAGTVKISISSPDGRNAILNLVGPGETFGEMSVLDGQTRSADAIANTNCEIYVIDRRDFLPFMRNQPALSMKFIELLCDAAAMDQRPGRAGDPAGSAGTARQRAAWPGSNGASSSRKARPSPSPSRRSARWSA